LLPAPYEIDPLSQPVYPVLYSQSMYRVSVFFFAAWGTIFVMNLTSTEKVESSFTAESKKTIRQAYTGQINHRSIQQAKWVCRLVCM
jgi:hypothetical protein